MKLEQFKYPFSTTELIFAKPDSDPNKRAYKHLGIECPHNIPISEFMEISPETGTFKYNTIEGNIFEPIKDFPIIVTINPPENSNNSNSNDENSLWWSGRYEFYLTEQEVFEIKIDSAESIKVRLPEEQLNNRYLIISAAYEITN